MYAVSERVVIACAESKLEQDQEQHLPAPVKPFGDS